MILKEKFIYHFWAFEFTLSVTLLFLIGWWYVGFDKDYALIIGLYHGVFTLPALYLHLEYTLRNLGEEIEIREDSIVWRKGNLQRTYRSEDLTKIVLYKSASMDAKGMPLTAMERFYFARISTNVGDEIIIHA